MRPLSVLASLLLFVFIGCYSTYSVDQYPSKDKFYEDFNNSVKNKNIQITFKNDSTITAYEEAKITQDTLIFISQQSWEDKKVLTKQVRKFDYYESGTENLSAIIHLETGDVLQAEHIVFLPDSSIQFKVLKVTWESLPLTKIKDVRYKNSWLGVPSGLLMGGAAGFIAGFAIGRAVDDNTQEGDVKGADYFFAVSAAGLLTGGVLGWLTGYKYIYEFNR